METDYQPIEAFFQNGEDKSISQIQENVLEPAFQKICAFDIHCNLVTELDSFIVLRDFTVDKSHQLKEKQEFYLVHLMLMKFRYAYIFWLIDIYYLSCNLLLRNMI